MRRIPTLIAIIALVVSLIALSAPVPASAATKAAGIADLTPYGGYLGNYLAPDGTVGYCIDSALPWPSGATSGAVVVTSLATTWGDALSPEILRKLNFVLATYGQTDDPVQAAAVAAFVNAYTSGWARDLGQGYAAGAWYLNGDATVTAVYDSIWSAAEAEAGAVPNAVVTVAMSADLTGTVTVSASNAAAKGTVTVEGAVRADTGETSWAVDAEESVAVRASPAADVAQYEVVATADYALSTPAPSLTLYETAGQQRLVRAGDTAPLAFSASASSGLVAAPPRLAETGGDLTGGSMAAAAVALGVLMMLSRRTGISTATRR